MPVPMSCLFPRDVSVHRERLLLQKEYSSTIQKYEKLSIDEFVDTVSRSALGTNNAVYIRQMAEHSMARVNELRGWGFFDSPLYNSSFSKPITARNIPVMERIVITHLIKEEGRIAGAAGFSLDEAKIHIFNAKSVILCTGAGGFKPNGFPICDLTHDGTIMAYNIGAKVTGKEWNDVIRAGYQCCGLFRWMAWYV